MRRIALKSFLKQRKEVKKTGTRKSKCLSFGRGTAVELVLFLGSLEFAMSHLGGSVDKLEVDLLHGKTGSLSEQ